MPLYEYECESCGTRFEKIQKFSDPPIDVCPKCGKGPVNKLISSPAIQFKGSGWYVTDYGKGTKDTKGSRDTRDTKDTKDTKDAKDTKGSKEQGSSEEKGTKETSSQADTKTTTSSEKKG
jgi:putative FmdB family regulatory protein